MKTTVLIATLLLAQHVACQHYTPYDDEARELQWMHEHRHRPDFVEYEEYRHPDYDVYDDVVYDVPMDGYEMEEQEYIDYLQHEHQLDEEEYLHHLHRHHHRHHDHADTYDSAAPFVKRAPLFSKIKPVKPAGAGAVAKPKTKMSTGKKVAIGTAVVGAGALGVAAMGGKKAEEAPPPVKRSYRGDDEVTFDKRAPMSGLKKVGLGAAVLGAGYMGMKAMGGGKKAEEAPPVAKRSYEDDDAYYKRAVQPVKRGNNMSKPAIAPRKSMRRT